VRETKMTDYRFSSIVMGIVTSVPFQMRAASVERQSGTR